MDSRNCGISGTVKLRALHKKSDKEDSDFDRVLTVILKYRSAKKKGRLGFMLWLWMIGTEK